ncbi:transposase [Kordia sp.]|uniref:transposase n=1 Tax=Kordia sp. TaxID=1965332 RepID=UPI0025C42A38|nr:transposase [Kordia sp.]
MTYQELLTENQSQKAKIFSLKEQLSQLYKLLSGFKSECFVENIIEEQLNLFSESHPEAITEISKETITYSREKKKHCGRNALPGHLPVKEIVIEPKEDITGLKKIGEEVTENLKKLPDYNIQKLEDLLPKSL